MDREDVLDAAMRLLSHDRSASMTDVATATGVSRATLHRMFAGRDDLVGALNLHAAGQASAALDRVLADGAGPADALRALVAETLPLAASCAFLMTERLTPQMAEGERLWDELDARLRELVRAAQAAGRIRIDVSDAWVVEAFFSLITGAGDAVACGRLAAVDVERQIVITLFDGIARTRGGDDDAGDR